MFFPDTDLVLVKLFLCKPFSLPNRSIDKKADAWPDSVVWSPFGPVYELNVCPVLLVHSKSEFWSCTYPHKPDSKSQVPGAVNKSNYTRVSRFYSVCEISTTPPLLWKTLMHCLAIAFTQYRDDLRISTHEKRWARSVNSLKERLPVFNSKVVIVRHWRRNQPETGICMVANIAGKFKNWSSYFNKMYAFMVNVLSLYEMFVWSSRFSWLGFRVNSEVRQTWPVPIIYLQFVRSSAEKETPFVDFRVPFVNCISSVHSFL